MPKNDYSTEDYTQFSGEYITDAGSYDVKITSDELTSSKEKGTPGVMYHMETANGSKTAVTFWLSDAAKPRLRSFAKACGLSDEEMRTFNPANLTGRQVNVTFEKPDKYIELKSWEQVIEPFDDTVKPAKDNGLPF